MNQISKNVTTFAILFLVLSGSLLSGCGKPISATDSASNGANSPQVRGGNAGFGTQCPYANIEDPVGVQLDASDCGNGNTKVQLAGPLEAIILQADCRNKNMTARTGSLHFDGTFETLPDGVFYFQMKDAGYATLQNGCKIPLVADLSGNMQCGHSQNIDRADINVDSVWKIRPTPAVSGRPAAAVSTCGLPATCTFHAATVIHQCK